MRTKLGMFLVVTILAGAILGGLLGDRVNADSPLEKSSQNLLKAFTEKQQRFPSHPVVFHLQELAKYGLCLSVFSAFQQVSGRKQEALV